MEQRGKDDTKAHEDVIQAVEETKAGNYGDAISVFEKHLDRLAAGTIGDKRVSAASFSYYGLCVAMLRRRYADAVKYCQISLRTNPLDPQHRANLALVYMERNDRAKAVQTLNSGLRLDKNNRRIHQILNELGRRRPPVIPFFSRNNPLNIWLGRRRASKTSK